MQRSDHPCGDCCACRATILEFHSLESHPYLKLESGVLCPGTEAVVLQVPETLPEGVLQKMHAPPKPDVPIVDVHDLPSADGFVFAFPTRYGMPPAQFKAFMDATGQLWQSGALVGKPVTFITSTASLGGGQEVTIASSKPSQPVIHLTMSSTAWWLTIQTTLDEQCKSLLVNGIDLIRSPKSCSSWLSSSQ
ncbi:TPA: hypothetical protein ACH3X2_009019 [Trebouxia sp. C0005]